MGWAWPRENLRSGSGSEGVSGGDNHVEMEADALRTLFVNARPARIVVAGPPVGGKAPLHKILKGMDKKATVLHLNGAQALSKPLSFFTSLAKGDVLILVCCPFSLDA